MDPIIIAGAGPVGCAAALYLAEHDIPVMLLESQAELPRDLRASTFHPPTLDQLAKLGLVDQMIKDGLIVSNYQYRDRKTNEIARFDLSVLEGETDHPYRLQCEQFKMTRIVVDRLNKMPNADVRMGTRLKGFRETSEGIEALIFNGSEKRVKGSYLIGCDGANSVVRQTGGVCFEGMTYPELFLVASTPYKFDEYFEGLSQVNYVSDPDEWCVLLATADLWRVLIPTPLGGDPDLFISDKFIQDRLHRLVDHDKDFDIVHRTLYHVHQRVAETYRVGERVLIAGDAAHVNNPLGGMGMNGGVHDAINLSEKLVKIIKDGADRDEMLDLYNRQRRGICTSFIQKHTKKNKELMESTDPDIQRKRQERFMRMSSDPVLAKEFVMETSMINCLRESYEIR